jgi:prepilin-type N-terminal cleavage/methylation domain-containing protein
MKMIRLKSQRDRRSRTGFTLVETMVAVAISGLVGIGLSGLVFHTARTYKDLFGQTNTRSARLSSLDQIRYRLVDARIGSCVVSDSSHRIEFVNPTLGGVTSALYFVTAEGRLYYDNNIADGTAATIVAEGPVDVTFSVEASGAVVNLAVRTNSTIVYTDVDSQAGTTLVYLRNT